MAQAAGGSGLHKAPGKMYPAVIDKGGTFRNDKVSGKSEDAVIYEFHALGRGETSGAVAAGYLNGGDCHFCILAYCQ